VFNGFDYDELYDLHADPQEMRNQVGDSGHRAQADDMRARIYEMMDQFQDPYGHVQARHSIGPPPDRYGAPRYLPRGKRI
jgi:hypothetical protein